MGSQMVKRVLSLLSRNKGGMSLSRLYRELRLSPEEKVSLRRQIRQLESQGIILKLRKKYFLRSRSNISRGKFVASGRGFGFVIPEEEYIEDIFVPARFAGNAYHGDLVEVHYKERGRKNKPEGRVLRILEKKRQSLLGICRVQAGQIFFVPFGEAGLQEIPVKRQGDRLPSSGEVIRVRRATLSLEEILGDLDTPGVDVRVIIERHGLEDSFSPEALEEANSIPDAVTSRQRKERIDHTDWQTVTIDGESAQDFDDAVSIKALAQGNYLLGVHIADVSHYVQPGTALDIDAFRRGTSVYFPDLTLPMLPEKLSNQVCSLRPREEKLTVSVVMKIDGRGNVLQADFYPSLIRTVERMTYNSVLKIIRGDKDERKRYAPLVMDLIRMWRLSRILRAKRIGEGGLDFDLAEPELVYQDGRLYSVIPFEANEAHHIIEEFMVLANESVASYLAAKDIPLIYRVHPKPLLSDLDNLRELLENFHISLPPSKKNESADLQRVLEHVRGKPEEKFVTLQVLKSLRLAEYSAENAGHYGLAKEKYTHFTSPIRRYPDLMVHRILKQAFKKEKVKTESLASVARHCSQQERTAEEAEKDLVEWRIYRFLKGKLGDEFEGVIVDITGAGLVVELDDYFVHGLVPFRDLGSGYFFKKSEKILIGKKSGRILKLGGRVEVVLVSVNPILRRMDLMIVPVVKNR
jgi:ribonuclease R